MATIDQVRAQIRFALEQLSAHNGHHEFEHLCRHLARQRICSNILPATGPVSSGGDQARDFETFRSYLSRSCIAESSFMGLVAEKPLAFCCSLQKSVKPKIKADVKTIASSGAPVEAVYYFCAEDLAVAQRHEIQGWALDECAIRLEILDGQAISEQLSDHDIFWIAEQYLKIPIELYPDRPSPKTWSTASLPNFVGREVQLAELKEKLSQGGAFVPVIGMPGLGKTYLAREFIRRHGPLFAAVYELDCQKKDLAALTGDLAALLDLRLEGQTEQVAADLRRHLARQPCLLLLDNVEDDQPSALVPGGAAAVLVTSRDGTIPFLADYQELDLPLFTDQESLELFRRVLGEFPQAPAMQLFNKLGQLPMAIAVAAGLIKHDVRYTVKSLALSLPPLESLAIGKNNVGRLMVEAIGALRKREQQLIRAMAACAPAGVGFAFAAEAALLKSDTALDALQGLHARSLITELDREARRYRLHPLIRKAAAPDEAVRRRHCALVEVHLRSWKRSPLAHLEFLDEAEQAVKALGENASDTLVAIGTKAGALSQAVGRWNQAYEFYLRVEAAGTRAGKRMWQQIGMGNRAGILYAWGRLQEALELYREAEVLCQQSGDRVGLQGSYGNRALVLQAWGRFDEAMALHEKRAAICKELGDRDGLATTCLNQAGILNAWGRPEEAMVLLQKGEEIWQELGDRNGLARSYANQALILKGWGRLGEAMALLERTETIFQELGDRAGLAQTYGSQAMILKAWGRLDQAIELLRGQEAICKELSDRAGLQRAFGGQALIEQARGRLEEAMALHQKEEAICQELANRDGLARSYGNRAVILMAWGRAEEASVLHQKQEGIYTELGDRAGLARTYGTRALTLVAWGRLDEAMDLHRMEEAIFEELGDLAGLARTYFNQASVLRLWGKREDAMVLMRRAEAICHELADRAGLGRTYANQALILHEWGNLEEALALLRKQEAICEELRDQVGLAQAYDCQAMILAKAGRLPEATTLLQQEESICLEDSDRAGLARTYGHQAVVLYDCGRLDEAMALHRQEEAICQALNDSKGLGNTYGNQALILRRWGKPEEAMVLLEKVEAICQERNDRNGLARTYRNQSLILQDWGRLEEATTLLQKDEAICLAVNDRAGLAHCYRQWGSLERQQKLEGTAKLTMALSIFTELNMPRECDVVGKLLAG
jgi:tetratricopeptide (TPR) repeat protein